MEVWCEFCAVCGGPPLLYDYRDLAQDEEADKAALQKLLATVRWIEEWIGIPKSENHYSLRSYDNHGGFEIYDGLKTLVDDKFTFRSRVASRRTKEKKLYAVGCHRACFTVLWKELKFWLRFADISSRLRVHHNSNLVEEIDYSDIAKYQGQSFDIVRMLKDGNDWMLLNPLENAQNRERIVKMWTRLVKELQPPKSKAPKTRPTREKASTLKPAAPEKKALQPKTPKARMAAKKVSGAKTPQSKTSK
jgi:hypothetical protein